MADFDLLDPRLFGSPPGPPGPPGQTELPAPAEAPERQGQVLVLMGSPTALAAFRERIEAAIAPHSIGPDSPPVKLAVRGDGRIEIEGAPCAGVTGKLEDR